MENVTKRNRARERERWVMRKRGESVVLKTGEEKQEEERK